MGKLDELRRQAGGNVSDSMGVGRAIAGDDSPSVVRGAPARWQGVAKSKNAAEIPVDRIAPDPDQPREEFDGEALERLAESLKTRGQLQPIRVRWDEGRGLYVIVCGERRWRAAGLAGLPTLSCVVMDGPVSPSELLALQLIENCVREDLQPIEQAKAYRALMELNSWSVRQVARELAIDHGSVSRALALLELPNAVQEHVEQGAIAPATAYELSKVEDPEAQRDLAERVVKEKLSRADTVRAVQTSKGRGKGKASPRRGKPELLKSRVFRLAGGRVTIDLRKAGDVVAMLAVARELVATLEAEMAGQGAEAA